MYKNIEFASENAILRGRLYCPKKASRLPIIIMAHGYSATIEGMCADKYAEEFYHSGYAVLLYDHRGFGISEGEPRHQTNKWIQARGYRDAINFVSALPEVNNNKISLWGVSMGASAAIVAASIDHRVKALITLVPACDHKLPKPDTDGQAYQSIRETFLHGNVNGTPETTFGPIPVVSFDQNTVRSILPTLTAFRWFMEYGGRYNTKWENSVTHVEPNVPVPFNSVVCIPHIKAAILMIVAECDEVKAANSDVARYAYKCAPKPKKLLEVDGGHFGLLHYPSELFIRSSSAQIDFLKNQFK